MALKIIHTEKAYIIVDTESQEQPRLNLMRIITRLRAELLRTEQAADKLRDELDDGYARLDTAGIAFADGNGVWLPIADRIEQLCTNLAQVRDELVTEKTAALLERLATYANLYDAPQSSYDARELAARIREALEADSEN